MAVDFDPTRPIYLQIIERVKTGAARGEHAPGAQLPSVRDMAAAMGVNPNTMARAYRELEREGFVETRRGEGSFVTADARRIDDERQRLAAAARQRFVEQLRRLALSGAQVRALLADVARDVAAAPAEPPSTPKGESTRR